MVFDLLAVERVSVECAVVLAPHLTQPEGRMRVEGREHPREGGSG